ncbi:hypothetical protein MMC08_009089 [Hypocenomyce scalaris]|nr:hypothetical protein [Hypocenomyce scalaris]
MTLPAGFKLANGMMMPAIGLGTFQADGDHSTVKDAVLYALSVGYRHFDTAFNYENEAFVGEAVRESGIPREEISITTKLSTSWHRPEDVKEALRRSLNTLGLSYVDYYLMHWPHCYVVRGPDRERLTENTPYGKKPKPVIDYQLSRDYVKVWRAMEALVDEGMAKAIAHQPLGGNPPPKSGPHPDIPGPMRDEKLKALAEKNHTSPAQVLLAWAKLSKLPQADLDALSVLKEKHDFIRFLDPTDYLGFDVFNEEADEPIADKPPWRKSE